MSKHSPDTEREYSSSPEEGYNMSERIKEVHTYLQENQSTGVLVGGMAATLLSGGHIVELEARKDVDVLVLDGEERLSHESEYDLFLKSEKGGYKNRNDYSLPYHVHLIGPELKKGLHLLPPEVIFLTESEMSTRRAIDRAIPDTLNLEYSNKQGLETIPKEQIILEFPGDTSWIGSLDFGFPVQIITKRINGQKRTFISFSFKTTEELPQSAFMNESEVRCPESTGEGFNAFPKVELTDSDIKNTGVTLIEKGFLKEGINYMLERKAELADDLGILEEILKFKNRQPIQCAEALGLWLLAAEKHNFTALFYLSDNEFFNQLNMRHYLMVDKGFGGIENRQEQIDEKIRKIAESILEQFGTRYIDLCERISKYSIKQLLPTTMEEFIEKYKHLFCDKLNLNNITASSFRPEARKNDPIHIDWDQFFTWSETKNPNMLSNKVKGLIEGKATFTESFYYMCDFFGISDEDIITALKQKRLEYEMKANEIWRDSLNTKPLNRGAEGGPTLAELLDAKK